MILVDTSVWIDHFRSERSHLIELLRARQVLCHAMVIGELACGLLRDRTDTFRVLSRLPSTPLAGYSEVLYFIEQHRLMGRGIGYVDVHLLASAALVDSTELWTIDRRLLNAAEELNLAYQPMGADS